MDITFSSNGQSCKGYLAVPESGSGPGVIVIQEWWGLVGHIKNVADRLAGEGFTALAPDLYQGESTEEPDEAGSLMMALNIEETREQLSAAVQWLLDQPSCSSKKVGVVGFCMGGQLSLFAACTNPQIGACVDFYGIHPNVHPPLEKLQAPVLGIFAEHDDYASPEAVKQLEEDLTRHGKDHEFITYPGTHHAFFNDDRPAYDAEASADAWKRVLEFFRRHLS